jgi:hypothetical protein
MKKNGAKKKKRDPNALRRYIGRILFWIALVFINMSGKIIIKDTRPVSQSQVREIKNKWKRQQKRLLYRLIFIHQNHIMADVFDTFVTGDGLLSTKRLLPSARDAIRMINEIVDRYETMIGMCHTRQDVKALSMCLENNYYKVFADINCRIDRFEKYVDKRNVCQIFVARINALQKELEEPFWQSLFMTEESKVLSLKDLLKHILKDWEQTKLQNTVSAFDAFYNTIKHREQFIERLWEEVLPKSNICFEEYDAKRDEWHPTSYGYEQFQ